MPANLDPTTVSSIPLPSSPCVFTSKLISLPSFSSTPLPDPQASPSPSTPFANLSLLSPTASHSSDSSPLSPKLSTLTSSFLSITSTSSPDAEPRGPVQMDVDKDPRDSGVIPCPPLRDARSPSPQPLTHFRRMQSPPRSQVESPSSFTSPSQLSPAAPEASGHPDLPPALSPPPASPTPPPLPAPKVKMSLKDFAMRRKKQREEELARAAAQSPSLPSRNARSVDVVASNAAPEALCSPGVIDGPNEATASDIATPKVHTTSVYSVAEPAAVTHMDSKSSVYNLPINGVHFDASLASTLAEIAQAIPPSQGCQLQDEVGPMKGSTPVTCEVICNGDNGGHLNNISPHSSRTPSPSLSESEESETGTGMTRGIPPTQPRSFGVTSSAALSSSSFPHRLPPSSTYRPGSSYVPPSIPASVRPLPSGPRALRAGLGGFSSQPASPFATARGYSPGQFAGVPRGPSVDRERDRGWTGAARGRGRGAASSWR
jgi:hypothetical protein